MARHLWTKGPVPPEYLELVLCRDIYHCTPLELKNIPAATIQAHLTCIDIEAQVRKANSRG